VALLEGREDDAHLVTRVSSHHNCVGVVYLLSVEVHKKDGGGVSSNGEVLDIGGVFPAHLMHLEARVREWPLANLGNEAGLVPDTTTFAPKCGTHAVSSGTG